MNYTALGLAAMLAAWAILGAFGWLLAAILKRPRNPLLPLPASMLAGLGLGALVPAVGLDGWPGLWVSLLIAFFGGFVATVAVLRRVG